MKYFIRAILVYFLLIITLKCEVNFMAIDTVMVNYIFYLGSYCYTLSRSPEVKIMQTYCHLRRCKSEQCRIAGTGNDYIGILRTTRSNRTCDNWDTTNTTQDNIIHRQIWNNSLFGDMSVEKAENFCRNPSRDVSGN